jgi:hypothetical protein
MVSCAVVFYEYTFEVGQRRCDARDLRAIRSGTRARAEPEISRIGTAQKVPPDRRRRDLDASVARHSGSSQPRMVVAH